MNERKTKGLTNLNSDEKFIRDICVSWAWMYFSQFAAISCYPIFPCGIRNLIFSYLGFLITKNRSKLGFWEVFSHLLKNCLMADRETLFTGILWVLSGLSEKWPLRAQSQLFVYFANGFYRIQMKLVFLSSLKLLWVVYNIGPQGGHILGPLRPWIWTQ